MQQVTKFKLLYGVNDTLIPEEGEKMKINYFWDSEYRHNEIGIQANPVNKGMIHELERILNRKLQLEVINPKNERRTKIMYS